MHATLYLKRDHLVRLHGQLIEVIHPMGQVLDPSRPWDFMQTPQT